MTNILTYIHTSAILIMHQANAWISWGGWMPC
jgi:hypothetical protein